MCKHLQYTQRWQYVSCAKKRLNYEFAVSVQGVKSLGGHFAYLCWGFELYEVKKDNLLLFFKKKMEKLLHL